MKSNNTQKIRQDKDNSCAVISAIFACKLREAIISLLIEHAAPLRPVSRGFRGTFFRFVRPKMTDIAAAFLKICVSYCFAVKIYHRQHSFNIVMTFLTSRTIVGLQTSI